MKVILCVLALVATVYCNSVMEHLPYFKKSELSEDFQKYEGLPDDCSQLSKDCVKKGHTQARHCIGLFYGEKRAEISECKNENDDLKVASKAWQEASFKWHKNLDDCLQGKDAPEDDSTDSDAVYFLFKRQAADVDCTEERDLGNTDFPNGRACWQTFKGNKKFCNHCVQEDGGCSKYIACTGRGSTPSDEKLAKWHRIQEKIVVDKQAKKKTAKRLLLGCIGMKAD